MKNLILFFLLMPFAAIAQKDFDYTFYTTKAVFIQTNDSIVLDVAVSSMANVALRMLMKIQKQNNVITISSTANSGDADVYSVDFLGWDIIDGMFVYQDKDGLILYINPIEGVLKIVDPVTTFIYY